MILKQFSEFQKFEKLSTTIQKMNQTTAANVSTLSSMLNYSINDIKSVSAAKTF